MPKGKTCLTVGVADSEHLHLCVAVHQCNIKTVKSCWGKAVLIVFFLVLMTGCRTSKYAGLETPINLSVANAAEAYSMIVQGAKSANWDVVGTDGNIVHLRRTRNIHVVYVDAIINEGEIDLEVVNAENLKFHRENKQLHNTGCGWMRQLRAGITHARRHDKLINKPYNVQNRIVSVCNGRNLKEVIDAVCQINNLETLSCTNDTLRVAYVGHRDLILMIRYSTLVFSIEQQSVEGGPFENGAYNEFVKKVESDIVRYADPAAWADKEKSDREHFDNTRQEEQLQRMNRFMRWGFDVD